MNNPSRDKSTNLLRISWSQIRTHEECKQKSFLQRSGKRGGVTQLRGFYHGMVVDAAMRQWLNNPDRTPGAMLDLVEFHMDDVARKAKEDGDGILRWKDAGDRATMRVFCLDLVERLEPILQRLILPYEFQAATRFRVPVQVPYLDTGTTATVELVGEMDLLTHPPDQWIVWDLKATKDGSYWRKVLGQLIFYDLAVFAMHGQRTEKTGLIQPMCTEPVVEFTISDDDRRSMWGRIIRLASDIWTNEAPCTTQTSNCPYCEVRHACPRFTPLPNTTALGSALRQAALDIEAAA